MFISGAASSANKSNGNNDGDGGSGGGGGGGDTHVIPNIHIRIIVKLHILFRRFTNCNRQLTTNSQLEQVEEEIGIYIITVLTKH